MSGLNLRLLDKDMNDKYQLLAKIGSGGMGDVFLGIQRGAVDFNRLVVIKRIHDHQDEYSDEYAKMFRNEASVVASLNHPHIVKIYDFYMTGSTACIVMEYIEGETLRYIFSSCQKNNIRMPIGLACRLIVDACDALYYAHNSTSLTGTAHQVIHRDIGLHNLMLDSNGYLKVIDFGIAKSNIQSDKTAPGLIKGNPAYMAPDLFTPPGPDHRIDIYGLGLCLYELLTGTRAFRFDPKATVGQILAEVCNRELPPPGSIVQGLPEGLEEIVLKSIEKNRNRRYQSTEAFARDLKQVVNRHGLMEIEPKQWFIEKFRNRLSERRTFGAKMIEVAEEATRAEKVSAGTLSQYQSNLLNLNSITPTPLAKQNDTTPPLPLHGKRMTAPLSKSVAITLFLLVGCVALLSFFLYRQSAKQSASKKTAAVLADNLIVSCEPVEATLFIDGQELGLVGRESLSVYVEPNKAHEVVLKKDGFREFSLPFIGPQTGAKRINATLKKIDPDEAEIETPEPADEAEIETPEPTMVFENEEPVESPPNPVILKRKRPYHPKQRQAKPPTHKTANVLLHPDKKEDVAQSSPTEPQGKIPLLDVKKPAIPMVDDSAASKSRKSTPAASSADNGVPLL